MANYHYDNRVVMTLDAGGTNMVFSAMQSCRSIIDPITLPARADVLSECLEGIVEGFTKVKDTLSEKGLPDPIAISFAFPGPADYPNGIIGGYLPNFPSFRDGVALGPFLRNRFGLPVFINNDGDLYAFGEALGGALPEINAKLKALGSSKVYRNLIGYTLGTGFGVGIVIDGNLNRGDNSCVETFCLKHPTEPYIIEDGASIRAVKRVYAMESGNPEHGLEPKDIAEIALGQREGDRPAALKAFETLGEVAGEAMAVAASLVDGVIVIGGGLMKSSSLIMPGILKVMRSSIGSLSGDSVSRVQPHVFDLDDDEQFSQFAVGSARALKVYGSEETVVYDPMKRIGVMSSHLGTSEAISLGAYAFALSELDKQ